MYVCVNLGTRWSDLAWQGNRTEQKKSLFSLSLSLVPSFSVCAWGEIGEVIKQNKSVGRVASPESRILNPFYLFKFKHKNTAETETVVYYKLHKAVA